MSLNINIMIDGSNYLKIVYDTAECCQNIFYLSLNSIMTQQIGTICRGFVLMV